MCEISYMNNYLNEYILSIIPRFLIFLNSTIKKVVSILVLSSFLLSENISGTITDQSSGEPLPYTNIILLENNRGTATDISGYYIIPNIDFGSYTIKIMMIGYTTIEKSIQLDTSSSKFDFELIPEPIQGNEIKVSTL